MMMATCVKNICHVWRAIWDPLIALFILSPHPQLSMAQQKRECRYCCEMCAESVLTSKCGCRSCALTLLLLQFCGKMQTHFGGSSSNCFLKDANWGGNTDWSNSCCQSYNTSMFNISLEQEHGFNYWSFILIISDLMPPENNGSHFL